MTPQAKQAPAAVPIAKVAAETTTPEQPQEKQANLLEMIVQATDPDVRQMLMDASKAKTLSESKYFANTTERAQALTKMMFARALGLDPILCQKDLNIIKGNISPSAELIDYLMKRCGYSWKMIEHTDKDCSIAPYKDGVRITDENGSPVVVSFTYDDAVKAGLANAVPVPGNPTMYEKYGRNMLLSRCRVNMQRWYAPEATKGATLLMPDEIEGMEGQASAFADGIAAATASRAEALKARLAKQQEEQPHAG